MKINWPNNKKFAFTIIDDTDNSTVSNVKPVYDLLYELGLITTKTVWVYPPRDKYKGGSIIENEYQKFVLDLKSKKFEIAFHGVGSGDFTREEILQGLEEYKIILGGYPKMHINHAQNSHNLFWGKRTGSRLLQSYMRIRIPNEVFFGDKAGSRFYWGDFVKQNIKYIRSRVTGDINTLKFDTKMPYRDKDKETASNFWFSSSDAANVEKFNELLNSSNVDRLEKEGGLCIAYTHFASGFVDSNGKINAEFEKNLRYLASKGAWFAPASEILDYLLEKRKGEEYASEFYFTLLDIKLLWRKFMKRF